MTANHNSKTHHLRFQPLFQVGLAKPILLYVFVLMLAGLLPALSSPESDLEWQHLLRSGVTALDANEYWIAEPILKKAVIQAGAFGLSDMRMAKGLGELGRLYAVRGDFATAEPYLEEELCVKENVLGKESGQIIPSMATLSKFYLLHGTESKAGPLTDELLSYVEGKLREPIPQTPNKIILKKGAPLVGWAGTAAPVARDPLIEWAIACDDLGSVYRLRGDYDIADRLFKAALDMKSTVLGKEHLSLANSYDSLGDVWLAKGDLAEAASYYRDALTCTERVFSSDDPAVYGRLDKLAKCQVKLGKFKEAEELYLRAQNFWKDDPLACGSQARVAFALGSLYDEQKSYAEAEPLLKKALDLAEQSYGTCSADLVPYLQKYAYTLYYLGRKPEMEEFKIRATVIANGVQ